MAVVAAERTNDWSTVCPSIQCLLLPLHLLMASMQNFNKVLRPLLTCLFVHIGDLPTAGATKLHLWTTDGRVVRVPRCAVDETFKLISLGQHFNMRSKTYWNVTQLHFGNWKHFVSYLLRLYCLKSQYTVHIRVHFKCPSNCHPNALSASKTRSCIGQ